MEATGISLLDLSRMAPEWLFLTIKTTIATICCVLFVPCCIVMIRTKSVHVNCKMILIASSLSQQLLLLTQVAMFVYDIIIGNLMPETEEQEFWFCMVHEMAYFMTTYISLLIVIERFLAAKLSAQYESYRVHNVLAEIILAIGLCGSGPFAYAIHALGWYFPSIGIMLVAESSIIVFSILLLFYSLKRMKVLPYDRSRLGAKYQLGEVSAFTRAILPPIMVSSCIKTIGLIPPTLWKLGYFGYPYSGMFFFCTHAINCVVVKGLLIVYHRGFRRTFARMICSRKNQEDQTQQQYEPAVHRSSETAVHFKMLNEAWSQPAGPPAPNEGQAYAVP